MFTILFYVFIFIIIIASIKMHMNANRLVAYYRQGNVIQFGKKGKGKDLGFQKVIRKRKEKYYANMSYGGDYTPVEVKDLDIVPNTFITLINGEYHKVAWPFKWGSDVYISDGGIYLPSHEDNRLSKLFPSFPIVYALSRQLGEMNIHINSQALDRVWKKICEQGESYIKSVATVKFRIPFTKKPRFLFLFTKMRYYDRYDSALQDIRPMRSKMFATDRNLEQQFNAQNGEIKQFWIFTPAMSIDYDTYAFRRKLVDPMHKDTEPIIEKK